MFKPDRGPGNWKHRDTENTEKTLAVFNCFFLCASVSLCLNPTAHPEIGNTETQRTRREPPGFLQFCFFLCASVSLCFKPDRAPGNWKHRVTENTERAPWFSSIVLISAPLCLCVSNPTAHPEIGNTESQRTRREPEASDRSEISVGRGPVARFL